MFATTDDPDDQDTPKTFEPVLSQPRETPRIGLHGAKDGLTVNRSGK